MLGNLFGCKVNVNPLTVNSFNKDSEFGSKSLPLANDFLLLDGDNFLLLDGAQFNLLGP